MLFESYIHDFIGFFPSSRRKKEKAELRSLLEQKRRILTTEEVTKASNEVIEQILQSNHFWQAHTILIYYPIHNEINLLPLLTNRDISDKRFLMPVTHRNGLELREYVGEENLKKGKYGIPEPQTPAYKGKVDLMLIPGVGFDRSLHRMGRGKGYYDRLLKNWGKAWKVGIAYHFQLLDSIPHTRHDKKMNQIITAKSK